MNLTDSRLAALCSERVQQAFVLYQSQFHEINRRARERFLAHDGRGSFADAAEGLHLYSARLTELVNCVKELLGPRLKDRNIWMAAKAVYSSFIAQKSEWEIAESFFNSLTRRVFNTEGVDQAIEFVDSDYDAPPTALPGEGLRLRTGPDLAPLLRLALTDVEAGGFAPECWAALDRQTEQASQRVLTALPEASSGFGLEMITTAFFRGRGAYLVGRVYSLAEEASGVPLVFCVRNPDQRGLCLDAVLANDLDISILFSYTRAYFRADVRCPYELVRQLRTLMPHKRLADLYNGIGYHRHGKTELYRDFVAHLQTTREPFCLAEGARGMVMLVFTLPSYDVVFKLIKDRFDPPKTSTAADVKRSYRMVFEHDRAGRLVEAHEFEHLRIPRKRFEDSLVERLLAEASSTVRVEGRDLLIAHCYVERRVRPLNLYLMEEEPELSVAAALDYGQAIKDLAAANVFAGDIFTKNFGVTRTGRVVFYDYDELCYLTDCNFRDLPVPQTIEQEMAAEPWYSVRENDIFPEEFPRFLGLPEPARSAFNKAHGDLFTPDYWREVQARIRAGDYPEIFPYPATRRLPMPDPSEQPSPAQT